MLNNILAYGNKQLQIFSRDVFGR